MKIFQLFLKIGILGVKSKFFPLILTIFSHGAFQTGVLLALIQRREQRTILIG